MNMSHQFKKKDQQHKCATIDQFWSHHLLLFEKFHFFQIIDFINKNNLLNKEQLGFQNKSLQQMQYCFSLRQ